METENDVKAAVRSIISRSPRFALYSTKYRRSQIQNKMWLNVCRYGALWAICSCCQRRNDLCQRWHKMRSSHETRWRLRRVRKCSPLRNMGFVEGVVSFHTLCGVQSSPLKSAWNPASLRLFVCTWWSANGAGMARGSTLLVLAECCAQVRQRDFYSSSNQGNNEGVQMVPRPKPLSVR